MGQKVLILGDSGTGKSASLRNFKEDEIAVINCAGKPLPFRNHFEQHIPNYETLTDDVIAALDTTDKKVIVVDDAQYIMSFQFMRRLNENGWDKWDDIQGDFFTIVQMANYMPDDVTVYFMCHIARDDDGHEKVKTLGKMLDDKIVVEGLFTIVLKTAVNDGKYYFLTQNSGRDTVKSPIGMFNSYAIDNDLKYVDTKIRNYYEIGDYAADEEVAKMDETAAAPEIEKPDSDGRKRRRKKSETIEESEPEEKPKRKYTRKKRDEEDAEEPDANEAPAEEKPKRRRRKTANPDPEPAEDVEVEETPKRRRRRKKATETAENTDIAAMEMPEDEELPF